MNQRPALTLGLLAAAIVLAGTGRSHAAISVGPSGAGPIGFAAQPGVADGWSTITNAGGSGDITTDAALDAIVTTNAAAGMIFPVGGTTTTAPSISIANIPRWNSTLALLQSVPNATAYISILATLQNNTGANQSSIRISYTLGELHAAGSTVAEEIAGYRVYWSLTGAPGSWQVLSSISSVGTPGSMLATVPVGSWPVGSLLYILWADDNATAVRDNAGTEDGGYTLDNFAVTFGANQPPTVALTSPAAYDYVTASNVALWATAADVDGTVASVKFYNGNTLVGMDTTGSPYSLDWRGIAAGSHTLTAVATDNLGLSATSAPITIRCVLPRPALVPFGATWKYLDTGVDQGAAGGIGSWTDFLFDDGSWSSGVGELGYGDNDESTLVGFGPDANNKYITTYFRHRFNLADPNSILSLGLRLRADDGAVIYLNNQVLSSFNMPGGPTFQTLSVTNAEDDPIIGALIPIDGLSVFLLTENILAVEVHQSVTNTSDLSFDLELTANPAPSAPGVTINIPAATDQFVAPATIPFNVSAYDLDGGIVSMDFFDNGNFVGTFPLAHFVGTYNNVTPGVHNISVVVTDNSGLTATSTVSIVVRPAPVDFVLINTNAVWNYLDDGSDQGTAWREVDFPGVDTWLTGTAELGYGDGDETTVVNFGPDANNKFVTTYFRRVFNVASTNGFTNVQVRLRRDDGAVVYLNGTEIFRSNMPNGPVTYQTLAGANTGLETAFNIGNTNAGLLHVGDNVIAVEVHQNALASSDLSFELQLVGQMSPPALAVRLDTVDPTLLHLSWAPNLPGYQIEEATDLNGPWTPGANQNNPQSIVFDLNDPPRFFRLAAP